MRILFQPLIDQPSRCPQFEFRYNGNIVTSVPYHQEATQELITGNFRKRQTFKAMQGMAMIHFYINKKGLCWCNDAIFQVEQENVEQNGETVYNWIDATSPSWHHLPPY